MISVDSYSPRGIYIYDLSIFCRLITCYCNIVLLLRATTKKENTKNGKSLKLSMWKITDALLEWCLNFVLLLLLLLLTRHFRHHLWQQWSRWGGVLECIWLNRTSMLHGRLQPQAYLINQPTSQSVYQSTNQSANEKINQAINQSIKQSIN